MNNNERSSEDIRTAAENGDQEAQYNMGLKYADGKGVPQNYAEAVKWIRRAAEQGHAEAQNTLGVMYRIGEGVKQNFADAARWYLKAAEQGHAKAQFNMGYMYEEGKGVIKNHEDAARWYLKAAEQGHIDAQSQMGYMYYKGLGVAQDYTEAVKWTRKAAEQGEANAQNLLGVIYKDGIGITKDDAEANKWFRKAATQGHKTALLNWMEVKNPYLPKTEDDNIDKVLPKDLPDNFISNIINIYFDAIEKGCSPSDSIFHVIHSFFSHSDSTREWIEEKFVITCCDEQSDEDAIKELVLIICLFKLGLSVEPGIDDHITMIRARKSEDNDAISTLLNEIDKEYEWRFEYLSKYY